MFRRNFEKIAEKTAEVQVIEPIGELKANITERLTNPLIFSFLCAWIVINWRITIGLLWYHRWEIQADGSATMFDYISKNITCWPGFWEPVLIALAYTLAAPWVKSGVTVLQTWAQLKGEEWNLGILKGRPIPLEKYLNLKMEYSRKLTQLQTIIQEESNYQTRAQSLEIDLQIARQNKIESDSEKNKIEQKYKKAFDISLLNGRWTNEYRLLKTSHVSSEEIEIYNGRYSILDPFGEKRYAFEIKDFFYDEVNQQVFFTKELVDQQSPVDENGRLKYNINRLKLKDSNLISGYENGTTHIKYRRIGEAEP